jgi:hypothetical protein
MCSLTRTHVRLHPSHLQEKVGATAVAVVKTNNTTLTAGRGKKFKFGVWCMFWHACIECICPLWPSSHAPASACLSCMVRLLWHCQLLACIGQRRPAQATSFAAERATDTHHAWRREQQRCALHLPVFDFISLRVADHPLINSIVLTCAVGFPRQLQHRPAHTMDESMVLCWRCVDVLSWFHAFAHDGVTIT